MGRGEPTTGLEPCGRLLPQVLAQEPYRSGTRWCWMVDHGSSPRGETAKPQRHPVDAHLIRVHTPVHASGLKPVAISWALMQRKVLTPHDLAHVEAMQLRLAWDEAWSTHRPTPLPWKCACTALVTRLAKIKAPQNLLSKAQSVCTEEAA